MSRLITKFASFVMFAFAVVYSLPANATEGDVCGRLEKFGGDVQILNSDRSEVLNSVSGVSIPCDGWVSVIGGWVAIKHAQGFVIHASTGAFFQLKSSNENHVVLYRGEMFAQAGGGMGQLKIQTANGVATLKRSAGIVLYDPNEEMTQVISLENSIELQNRFLANAKAVAKEGEASSLSLKAKQVTPVIPRAVTLASLKPKVVSLHLAEREQLKSLEVAKARQDRKLASQIEVTPGEEEQPAPAAAPEHPADKPHAQHPGHLTQHYLDRLVAGEKNSQEMLFPGGSKIQIDEGPAAKKRAHQQEMERKERQRLMDDLSKVRPE